ncbi:hypothetical protein [Kineosporia babensis]|uniref:Uncharacterized protein n=1 Tax=Kineosporia babensis TaxID=499548 RepID=A0A9X1NNU9_9ACTN|nr:hypothetical protein [Kineosporia babensis]MCD5317189.1 hypothetical protein [Kineosporia babensis]
MDAIGAPPAPGDPTRQAWANAVTAVATYRTLWDHGHENTAIGEPPSEPVQARDWTTARRALDAWRWVKTTPQLAELDGEHLDLIIGQGNAGQVAAAEAAAAIAAHHVATAHQKAADQAAEDAANRLATARQNPPSPQGADGNGGVDDARLAELEAHARQTLDQAEQANQTAAATQARVQETAPAALTAREQTRAAEHARQQIAHRLTTAGAWQERPTAPSPTPKSWTPPGPATPTLASSTPAHPRRPPAATPPPSPAPRQRTAPTPTSSCANNSPSTPTSYGPSCACASSCPRYLMRGERSGRARRRLPVTRPSEALKKIGALVRLDRSQERMS